MFDCNWQHYHSPNVFQQEQGFSIYYELSCFRQDRRHQVRPKSFLRVLLGKPFRSRVIKSCIGKPEFITTAVITPSGLSI